MIDQKLIELWQSPENRSHVEYERTELIAKIESDLDRFRMAIKVRDWIEIGAALLMIPLFGFVALYIPIVLSKIGAGVIVIWLIFVIYKLLMTKRGTDVIPTDSYLNYLKNAKTYLGIQKKLLGTVLYWYILPFVTGLLIFFMGFDMNIKQRLFYISITLGVGAVTYLINLYAVRKGVQPRLKKVDEIIQDLEA